MIVVARPQDPAVPLAAVLRGGAVHRRSPGKYTPIDETIASFKALCEGEYDHLPEQAFFLVGGIEEAVEQAKTLEAA